jgi:hypothetical protein
MFMTQNSIAQQQKQGPIQPFPSDELKKQKQQQKQQENEVAGQHKNDGHKDHKGAR